MFFIVIGLMVASSLTGGVLSQEALADDMELVAEASMLPEGEYSGAVSDGLDTYPITLSITDGNAFAVITNDNTHEYLCTLGKAIVTDQYEVLFTEFKFDNTLTWSTDSGSGTSLGAGGIYAVLYGRITNTSDKPISISETVGSLFINDAKYQVADIEAVAPNDTSWEEDIVIGPLETGQIRLAGRLNIEDDIIGLHSIEFNWDISSINTESNKIEHDSFYYIKKY